VGSANITFSGAIMAPIKSVPAEPRPYHHGDLRQALVEAALALLTEEQDWNFSLREVARRAGVSHNAPYNHFPEKRDLLGAVAAVGFEKLRTRMLGAIGKIKTADAMLLAISQTYVGFAVENPALYRLMFGPVLVERSGARSAPAETPGAGQAPARMFAYEHPKAFAVLEDVILRGARSGLFAVAPEDQAAFGIATLSCWSAVHGLTMLIIDRKAETSLPVRKLVKGLTRQLLAGLHRR
jgi:AcrR family transcriptional regulator